ncbi:unnamed protein product [Lymnaea stagnalis]|uniref:Polypeptide N-acetylgalactosaminyltransferase n=1 Tax=Lymnaea stagnalis TaxID=6523 RepID=A0AAV2HIR4_LYMST
MIKAFLGAPLDKYFSPFPKVKIVRSQKKMGLIKARLLGFEASTAPVAVFLDAHIECFPDWADSLLLQIKLNPKAVVFPLIDSINDKTFGVGCNNNPIHYGTFHFKNLFFDWIEIPKREFDRRKDITIPFRSPVMPGGLFAISRKFFIELGTYDPEMDFWGGENIELSFKTWMCGGALLMDVCSHVGHVFRSSVPTKGAPNAVIKNSMRVAEVWMDNYKNYFYEATNYQTVDYGNVTDRKILRDGLKCHSFEWFLRNVFPELVIPHGIDYVGEIRSAAAPKCLDSGSSTEPGLIMYGCHGQGNNQLWYFNNNHQIFRENIFLCVKNGSTVLELNKCSSQGNWRYQEDKSLVYLPTNECLTAGVTDSKVSLTPCHPGNKWQQWHVQRRRSDLNFPK